MRYKIILFAALFLLACTKNTLPTKEITFRVSGVRSGEIATKADPSDILAATAPSSPIVLSIKSTTNPARAYSVKAGEGIALPLDTYDVTGTYTPATAVKVWRGTAYREPRYSVSAQVTITEEITEVSVPASYDCFALIIDFQECEKYRHELSTATMADITEWAVAGDYGVLYVTCSTPWAASHPYPIQAFPVDTAEGEMQQYSLITTGTGGKLVENGRWYCFAPGKVEKLSGLIGTTLPEWINGNE